ncbi:cobalt transporter CbiM [uncultured Thiodictyon sp.]|jgi:cobalt/nickel transport system permease protein|uniref:cobalt transporter CbiM n=1 Tax=uncultured Thiodictyon sp. TaxID=1846217 RepID=UPI0025E04BE7|nr:cobalt transporter CbiM [uncultured Thiodictyon sp.]
MHVPDGYLSPLTCAAAYAVAAPFWFVALRKVEAQMQTRLVPTVAVVSAFSFVIMMFNLPLPGGTTGHAIGLAVAPILLGPWAAMLAISIALFIQALFFGDGGITTFGANCVNMAIAGPWVAYWVYRLISGDTPLTSPRRVVAAATAGYVAINVAALLAAVQFGIQPIFFHDAAGAPLYAPYALVIAIPAMMIGHLSFAGLAEAVISGGVVAYVQKVDPRLLSLSARRAAASLGAQAAMPPAGWRPTRALWAGLAALLIASPLGLLAGGIAWGEWGVDDLKDTAVRAQIAQASGNVVPPESVPQGMERLSAFWTAPMPDYAPAFLHHESFGYLLCAMVGTGLVVLSVLLLSAVMGGGRAARATPAP